MTVKRGVGSVAAVVLLGLLGWRVWTRIEAAASRPVRAVRPVAVAVGAASRRDIESALVFTGSLLPRTRVVVAPKVAGRLLGLRVNVGDTLTNGTLVAVLDDEEYALAVEQAAAELEVARAALAESRSAADVTGRELERARQLRAQQVASASELDAAEAASLAAAARQQVAAAQVRQREAARRSAEVRLSYTRVHATWQEADGGTVRRVAERFVDEGALLKANDPVVSVVDTRVVLAVLHVVERDYPDVQVGQEVELSTDAHPGHTFRGRLVRRAPVLREETRQARLEVEVENADGRLAPGMFVRARVRRERHRDARVIPAAALARRGGRDGVFVVDTAARVAHFVPVRTGLVDGDAVELLEPPELQGPLVTLGHHLLQDGSAVALPQPAAAAGAQP